MFPPRFVPNCSRNYNLKSKDLSCKYLKYQQIWNGVIYFNIKPHRIENFWAYKNKN